MKARLGNDLPNYDDYPDRVNIISRHHKDGGPSTGGARHGGLQPS